MLTCRGRREGFRCKSEGEVSRWRSLDAKLGKNGFGILGGKNRNVIYSCQESTNILALGGTEAAAEGGSNGERFNTSDIGPIGSWVRAETKAKERVITFDSNRFVMFGGERGSAEREARGVIRRRVE